MLRAYEVYKQNEILHNCHTRMKQAALLQGYLFYILKYKFVKLQDVKNIQIIIVLSTGWFILNRLFIRSVSSVRPSSVFRPSAIRLPSVRPPSSVRPSIRLPSDRSPSSVRQNHSWGTTGFLFQPKAGALENVGHRLASFLVYS